MRRTTSPRTRDGVLVTLALSAGVVDAISWLALGKVFSAFMSGNLAFLGFELAGADGPSALRVVVALAAFLAGAAIAARVVAPAAPGDAWPSGVTRALRLVGLLQAVFLVVWLAVDARPGAAAGDVLIALSSLAMGVQTVAIFTLGVRASFTTAATATLAVLAGDLSSWRSTREERLRLLAVAGSVIVGAAAGALLVLHAPHWAPALPLALTVGAVVVAHRVLEGGHDAGTGAAGLPGAAPGRTAPATRP